MNAIQLVYSNHERVTAPRTPRKPRRPTSVADLARKLTTLHRLKPGYVKSVELLVDQLIKDVLTNRSSAS